MAFYYGKREPGGLTASSPGDTLYFPFGSYNDSGDSEALTGLAVTDIEVFKNGGATARATDSGYSLISDTGQIGDRVGLYRFSLQIYNTTDDTGFYDEGSNYLVAVDGVTVDGKTVRFWVGGFEIGRQKVDVEEIDGDTGAADVLGKFASDTGALDRLRQFAARLSATGELDTGTGLHDTGAVATAVWAKATRTLTAFAFDTGVSDTVWKASRSTYTDTGSFGFGVNVHALRNDTGSAQHLAQLADEHDTGRLQAESTATLDTGAVNQAVWQTDASRTLTAATNLDTGISHAVWQQQVSSHTDTGSFGWGVNVHYINRDTGQAEHLGSFAANINTSGQLNTATYAPHPFAVPADVTQINSDTGGAEHLQRLTARLTDTGKFDTGLGILQADVRKVLNDTGAAHLVSGRLGTDTVALSDTGILDRLGKVKNPADTGVGVNIQAVNNTNVIGTGDTGIADTWRPG